MTNHRKSGVVRKIGTHATREQLRVIAWGVVITLGIVQAWASRYDMEPDGISYLDIADRYLQGDWFGAVNAYWSPLYSGLLAVALFVFRPSSYWEYPVVHLVNFGLYLISFVCFEFLLFQVIRYQEVAGNQGAESSLPPWGWQCIGYVLFLWSALFLITISAVTPDMGVAALVFLLGGILIRIRLQPERWSSYICFGLVLGVAYLTKAVMFPLGFVFLAICLVSVGNLRRAIPRVVVACLLFLLICAPFILALHRAKNRWTFTDTGRLAYAWLINGTEPYIHWRGFPPGTGVPAHPTRKIFDSPIVYEFKGPLDVTYPPWYDPSYWNEGIVGHFSLKGHVKVLGGVMLNYYAIFINSPIGMAALVSFLVFTLYRRPKVWEWITEIGLWNIILPAVAALALYSLVHVQTRYIGPFVVLLWLGLFSSVKLGNDESSRRLRSAVVLALVATSMTVIIAKSMAPAYTTLRDIVRRGDASPSQYWAVADGLAKLGVKPGDPIGSIAYGFSGVAYSARLAKLRIVAEISTGTEVLPKEDVDKFWHSDAETQRKVIEAFATTGAKAIVANRLPPGLSSPPGWQRIGNTDHYIYFLR